MRFDDKLTAMSEAVSGADAQLVAAVAPARDQYVLALERFYQCERAWLGDIADSEAMSTAAAATGDAMAARKSLRDAIAAAAAAREQTLTDTWNQLRTQ